MKITLVPQRRFDILELSVAGEVLSINGEELDLSVIPSGATLPIDAIDCDYLASDIERDENGEVSLSIILPHCFIKDKTSEEAQAVLFPDSITVTEDGVIELPVYVPPIVYDEKPTEAETEEE